MHFRLPKPLHGWRAFAGEVGIIVIGVLIALGAGQLVEMWHTRSEVADARQALSFEVADSIGEGRERERIYDCVEHRLDLLAAAVDKAASSGRLDPMPSPASPPYRTWLNSTWNSLSAGSTAGNFPRGELNAYADIYVFVDNLQEFARRELTVWSRLDSLAGPGRTFDPREAADFRNDITEARLLNRLTTVSGIRIRQAAASGRIVYDQRIVRDYAQTPLEKYPMCRRMSGSIPAYYGASAPLATALQQARGTPLELPGR